MKNENVRRHFYRVLFFDHMDLQIIKVDGFNETVLRKACFIMEFEVSYIGVQPYGLAQIEFAADLVQGFKDHGRAGHGIVTVFGNRIL